MNMKKKLVSVLLVLCLCAGALCAVACDGEKPAAGEVVTISPTAAPNSLGGQLWETFLQEIAANEAVTVEELARTLVDHPLIRFDGTVAPVEPGFLPGFDNYEVTGFRSGATFTPMIGSIPFVGYVFELEDGVSAAAFVEGLEKNANLRWMVCVFADQLVVGAQGNRVLFVMC
jgi:hypothetical protein